MDKPAKGIYDPYCPMCEYLQAELAEAREQVERLLHDQDFDHKCTIPDLQERLAAAMEAKEENFYRKQDVLKERRRCVGLMNEDMNRWHMALREIEQPDVEPQTDEPDWETIKAIRDNPFDLSVNRWAFAKAILWLRDHKAGQAKIVRLEAELANKAIEGDDAG